jgi:hypothetical protein
MIIKEMERQRKIFGLIRKLDSCSATLLRLGSCSTSAGLNREGKTNRDKTCSTRIQHKEADK